MDPLDQYREAIARIESGGRYDALGPTTRTGDRAFGRYQVMGQNVPVWTQAAVGRAMTPQEFLADPQAQDAVFNQRFGGYVSKFGNPNDAASAWFTGRPLAQGANAADVTGTTGQKYVDKFMAELQRPGASPSGPLRNPQPIPQTVEPTPSVVAALLPPVAFPSLTPEAAPAQTAAPDSQEAMLSVPNPAFQPRYFKRRSVREGDTRNT